MVLALAVISRSAEEVRASAACGVAPLHINTSDQISGSVSMSGDATPFPQDSAPAPAEAAAAPEATPAVDSAPAEVAAEPSADPEQRVRELEAELTALKAEHESVRSQYMRIAADFDNFRKRQSRDQEDQRTLIACSTLSEILPVVDNFERARQQLDPQAEEAQAIHRSYQGSTSNWWMCSSSWASHRCGLKASPSIPPSMRRFCVNPAMSTLRTW